MYDKYQNLLITFDNNSLENKTYENNILSDIN
jgi:hypothetical protein